MTEPIIETPVAPTVPVTEPVSTTTLTAEEAEKVRTTAKEMVARHAEKAEKATAELKAHKEKLAADAKEADRAKLEESDRLKLDIKEKDEQIADMATKAKQDKVENAIRLAGLKEGVVNADHLVKLMDASGVELAEDGSVTGLDEAVVKFKEENPFMFGKQAFMNYFYVIMYALWMAFAAAPVESSDDPSQSAQSEGSSGHAQ